MSVALKILVSIATIFELGTANKIGGRGMPHQYEVGISRTLLGYFRINRKEFENLVHSFL